jgi:hypothetical protein
MGMVLCVRRIEDVAAFRQTVGNFEVFFEFLNEPQAAEDLVDFDKAWQALHFVLNGSAWGKEGALGFLLYAGEFVGDDLGFGPLRLASPTEVRAFRDALAALDEVALRQRYDPAAMAAEDVYLADMLVEEGEEGWDYVVQSLPALRRLLERSVETSASVAIWLM